MLSGPALDTRDPVGIGNEAIVHSAESLKNALDLVRWMLYRESIVTQLKQYLSDLSMALLENGDCLACSEEILSH
jgi:hypothetical protein